MFRKKAPTGITPEMRAQLTPEQNAELDALLNEAAREYELECHRQLDLQIDRSKYANIAGARAMAHETLNQQLAAKGRAARKAMGRTP